MKKRILWSGSALLVLIAGFLIFGPGTDQLIRWQLDQTIEETLAAQQIPPTRFEIIFCGTGSPQHHPDRGQPCLGIIAAGKFFLFDAGQGTAQRLNDARAPIRHLDTVFLTHLHSDHMSGLGETLHNGWLYGRQQLVEVVGPPGTEKMLSGFQQVYADDIEERQRVIGTEYAFPTHGIGRARDKQIESGEILTVYEEDGVIIRAFQVDHPDWPYAYGYRIEYRGKSVVISGDTHYSPNLVTHAKDADILIHESLNTTLMSMVADTLEAHNSDITRDRLTLISQVHTPTMDVAKTATEANVDRLILTHLIPPIPANTVAENFFMKGMENFFDGDILVARDGMRLIVVE